MCWWVTITVCQNHNRLYVLFLKICVPDVGLLEIIADLQRYFGLNANPGPFEWGRIVNSKVGFVIRILTCFLFVAKGLWSLPRFVN